MLGDEFSIVYLGWNISWLFVVAGWWLVSVERSGDPSSMTIEFEMMLILIVYVLLYTWWGRKSSRVRKKKTGQWSIRVIYWIDKYTLLINEKT